MSGMMLFTGATVDKAVLPKGITGAFLATLSTQLGAYPQYAGTPDGDDLRRFAPSGANYFVRYRTYPDGKVAVVAVVRSLSST